MTVDWTGAGTPTVFSTVAITLEQKSREFLAGVVCGRQQCVWARPKGSTWSQGVGVGGRLGVPGNFGGWECPSFFSWRLWRTNILPSTYV